MRKKPSLKQTPHKRLPYATVIVSLNDTNAVKAGMQSLRSAAIRKMMEGATSFEEIMRVTL